MEERIERWDNYLLRNRLWVDQSHGDELFSQRRLNRWQQGKPIDLLDTAFYLTILIICFPDSWKTLWFHRSIET